MHHCPTKMRDATCSHSCGLPSLADLRENEEAVIVDVDLCSEGCSRLCELGLSPGVNVTMICAGRTSLVKAGRSRLSLRGEHLRSILVERIAP